MSDLNKLKPELEAYFRSNSPAIVEFVDNFDTTQSQKKQRFREVYIETHDQMQGGSIFGMLSGVKAGFEIDKLTKPENKPLFIETIIRLMDLGAFGSKEVVFYGDFETLVITEKK